MNTINTEHTTAPELTGRPLGFWLKASDRFMAQAFAEAFKAEGVSRREWHDSPIAQGIRARVTEAVPAEDLATTMRTLETIAREFGWDEETPLPRGRGFGRGDGQGHRGHFGHGGHGGYRGHNGHGGYGGDRHAARAARGSQQAYERGFDAGYSRGREI